MATTKNKSKYLYDSMFLSLKKLYIYDGKNNYKATFNINLKITSFLQKYFIFYKKPPNNMFYSRIIQGIWY